MTLKKIFPIVVLFSLACTSIFAEPGSDSAYVRQAAPNEGRSEGLADLLAAGGTLIPILAASKISSATNGGADGLVSALYLEGFLVGPSLGQFYLGSYGAGVGGTLIRTLGGALVVAGFATELGSALCGMDSSGKSCGDSGVGLGLLVLGAITYVGGTVYKLD